MLKVVKPKGKIKRNGPGPGRFPLRIQFIYSQQTVHVMYRDHAPRDVVRASGVVKAWSSVTGLFTGGVRPDVMNPRRARAFTSTGAEVEKAEDRHVHW